MGRGRETEVTGDQKASFACFFTLPGAPRQLLSGLRPCRHPRVLGQEAHTGGLQIMLSLLWSSGRGESGGGFLEPTGLPPGTLDFEGGERRMWMRARLHPSLAPPNFIKAVTGALLGRVSQSLPKA